MNVNGIYRQENIQKILIRCFICSEILLNIIFKYIYFVIICIFIFAEKTKLKYYIITGYRYLLYLAKHIKKPIWKCW